MPNSTLSGSWNERAQPGEPGYMVAEQPPEPGPDPVEAVEAVEAPGPEAVPDPTPDPEPDSTPPESSPEPSEAPSELKPAPLKARAAVVQVSGDDAASAADEEN